jgi:hypothetical protein
MTDDTTSNAQIASTVAEPESAWPLFITYSNAETSRSWEFGIQQLPAPGLVLRGDKPTLEELVAVACQTHYPASFIPILQVLIDVAVANDSAVSAEREACAQVCDYDANMNSSVGNHGAAGNLRNASAAIRARSKDRA